MINIKIKDKDFYKKINKEYKRFYISDKKKTFNEICFPNKYELQTQQQFLPQFINPKTSFKSILVFHKIGAGKTCTAVRIAEEWKHKKHILVVLPASLKGNFRNELRSNCVGEDYISDKDKATLKSLHPSSRQYKNIIKKSDSAIDKYYNIMSYNKFIKLAINKKIKLKDTLLIIDEIQNMVSETGVYYATLHNLIQKSDDSSRFVFMSATPMFDKPVEIALTLNLLNKNDQLSIGADFYKEFINTKKDKREKIVYDVRNLEKISAFAKGLVSYYRGAPPYVFPEATLKIVKCEMSNNQYAAYKTVQENETEMGSKKYKNKLKVYEANAVGDLPNNFFIGTRIISNVLYPNMKINQKGLDSFTGKYTTTMLEKYSIKFHKILKKIKKAKRTVFVYSSFKEYGGIKSFQKVLEDNDFKNYSTDGEGKNRFAVWSGDESLTTREEIRNVFNGTNNMHGEKIKVLLGSPAIKEGVSLYRVSQVHVIEPTWNWSTMSQIIGRAVRFCSHKDLDKDQRNVKVYIYIAMHPKEKESTDEYILNLAIQKQKLISKFEMVLKESAVDCHLFKNANYYKNDEDDIKCVK